MPVYKYKTYDRTGHVLEAEIVGESTQAVSKTLTQQGYIPITIQEVHGSTLFLEKWFAPRVKLADLNMFTRQLATLQKAGLPLENSLIALRDQVKNQTFKKAIIEIIKDVESGNALSIAFARHPNIFHPLYINMIKAGEASGRLEEILRRLAEMGEFEGQTRDKIHSATRYPILAFCSIVIAFLIVVTFVIPKFSAVFNQFKAQLPLPTRFLLGINYVVRHEAWLLVISMAVVIFLFRAYLNTFWGRYQWDWIKIKVPVFGPLTFNLVMSQFARILSELLGSGLPILQSLQIVADTVGNVVIQKAILAIRESVNEGKGMAEPMKRSRFFSPMVVQMVSVGEQSGETEALLKHVAGYYEEQANSMIKNLTTLIEPMLIMVLGVMVLILAMGVFLPMWDLVHVVK